MPPYTLYYILELGLNVVLSFYSTTTYFLDYKIWECKYSLLPLETGYRDWLGCRCQSMSLISAESMWSTSIATFTSQHKALVYSTILKGSCGQVKHGVWTVFKVSQMGLYNIYNDCSSSSPWGKITYCFCCYLTGFLGSLCCCLAIVLVFLHQRVKFPFYFLTTQMTCIEVMTDFQE